jgi:hypothetical protein
VFVDKTLGAVLILLSVFLYGLYLWLTRHFARLNEEVHPRALRWYEFYTVVSIIP